MAGSDGDHWTAVRPEHSHRGRKFWAPRAGSIPGSTHCRVGSRTIGPHPLGVSRGCGNHKYHQKCQMSWAGAGGGERKIPPLQLRKSGLHFACYTPLSLQGAAQRDLPERPLGNPSPHPTMGAQSQYSRFSTRDSGQGGGDRGPSEMRVTLKCHLPKCQRGCHGSGDSSPPVPFPKLTCHTSPFIRGSPICSWAPPQEARDALSSTHTAARRAEAFTCGNPKVSAQGFLEPQSHKDPEWDPQPCGWGSLLLTRQHAHCCRL